MSWATKRKIFYISIIFIFISLFVLYHLYPYLNRAPTCTDGKKNGDEVGIDCGGSCPVACVFEVDNLVVFWSRTFKIDEGKYSAIAYIENQNKDQSINNIKYKFNFADENNIYIGHREGNTYIPSAGKFAIFEQAIDLGYSNPTYTSFEFLEYPTWVNIDKKTKENLKIQISNIKFNNNLEIPRLSAKLKNNSFFKIPNFNAVAILYDDIGNAINISNTFYPILDSEEEIILNYTWREKFDKEPTSIQIIPMYNIFNVSLK